MAHPGSGGPREWWTLGVAGRHPVFLLTLISFINLFSRQRNNIASSIQFLLTLFYQYSIYIVVLLSVNQWSWDRLGVVFYNHCYSPGWRLLKFRNYRVSSQKHNSKDVFRRSCTMRPALPYSLYTFVLYWLWAMKRIFEDVVHGTSMQLVCDKAEVGLLRSARRLSLTECRKKGESTLYNRRTTMGDSAGLLIWKYQADQKWPVLH